jgi:hypothetical protein
MNPKVERLHAIPHFQRHPQMTPWVGTLYGEYGWKPLLFIGESHYLPRTSQIHLDARSWYATARHDLTGEEIEWTSLQRIIASGRDQRYGSKAHRLFANLERALLDVGFPRRPQMLDYAAFYNFFQRPARTGLSIAVESLDRRHAADVLREVTHILAPSLVCVVSRLSWLTAEPVLQEAAIVADFFPHPGSHWWNRQSRRYRLSGGGEPLTGGEKLRRFLLANRAFGPCA